MFPIFSPTDVFDQKLFEQINAHQLTGEDFMVFWRAILRTDERYITDIFMTPRWQQSIGAVEEHQIAQELGMNICYINNKL